MKKIFFFTLVLVLAACSNDNKTELVSLTDLKSIKTVELEGNSTSLFACLDGREVNANERCYIEDTGEEYEPVQLASLEALESMAKGFEAYAKAVAKAAEKEPKVKEPKVKEPKVKEPKVKEPKVKEPDVDDFDF